MKDIDRKNLLKMVMYHYPDASSFFCFGSRAGGWDRKQSDYDVLVHGAKEEEIKRLIFNGKRLTIVTKQGKHKKVYSHLSFILPRLNLETGEIDNINVYSIKRYLFYMVKNKKWCVGRDFSKIIGGAYADNIWRDNSYSKKENN